jgi:hypothetical protein
MAAAVLACACGTAPASAGAPLVRAPVDPSSHATPIARHFLGVSAGYRGLLRLIGNPLAGVNPAATGMLANLASAGQGEPGLRIGGPSADVAWWNPTAALRPDGMAIDIGPFARDAIVNFERATRAPLILDLNFAAGRVAYARDWAAAILPELPRHTLEALEIGDAPDGYAARGRVGYSFGQYARELSPFTRALHPLSGRPRLAAPATCCGAWDRQTARLARTQHGRLGLLSFHAYPTSACADATPATRLTVASLLGNATFRRAGERFAVIRAQAQRARLPVRITETNSAACGGRAGISDTYAASLWTADWLFLIAAQRFAGANVTALDHYTPFRFGYTDHHFVGAARAPYYGMLLFARAIADHARLLVRTTLAARASRGAAVHVWATADRRGHARVVVINKSLRRRGDAVLTVRDSLGRAGLERLTAPSLGATTGIALGGRAVPDYTTDGRLTGRPVRATITPHGHTYRFAMPPASAALLTVPIKRSHRR